MKQMRTFLLASRTFLLAAHLGALGATTALAHALLDHAVPAVGATLSVSPTELELSFTQKITNGFSGARLATAGGGAVAVGKASVDPANPQVLHVRLAQRLKPGVYVVSWRVVSVDTHVTTGSYKFTVAP